MPNLLLVPQQPFFAISSYFNHRISLDNRGPISPSSDGNSYFFILVDAFKYYVVFLPSPINDAAHALNILFDQRIVIFEIPVILAMENKNE